MKSEKGITLMILASTVIIMAVIVGTIAYSSITSIRMNVYYNMCADIELLDEKIALYYLEHKEEEHALPITEESKKIEDLIENYNENNVNYNPNNEGTLYKIDLTQLDNLSLSRTEYYIDEQSHTIYCSRGVKVDQELYYTLPQDYEKIEVSSYQ